MNLVLLINLPHFKMRKIITEFIVLIGIGGLVWAAISLLINLPSHPVILNPEKEKMLGDKYTEVILTFNGFEKIDEPEIDSVFKVVSERLSSLAGYEENGFTIITVKNEMVNAFALPGGNILITTGLIDFCESSAELFAILAHEAGHIVKRHIITRLIKELGLELLTSGNSYITAEIAKTLLSTGYNRKQEEEADLYACEILEKDNVEPRILASFFRRLKENPENSLFSNFEIISSHPNLEKRIKYVLAYEDENDFSSRIDWFSLELLKGKINQK